MVSAETNPGRGGAKRTPAQRERDLAETARLLLQRKTQAEIAVQLGITQQQVSLDMKLLKKRWREGSEVDFRAFLSEELALAFQVEAEAWRGWNRSTKDAITKTQEAKDGKEGREQGVKVRTTGQAGDPRFLTEVLNCSKHRLVLMGLLNPEEAGNLGAGGPGRQGYLDQVREEEEFLKANGNTLDEVLEALEAGPASAP